MRQADLGDKYSLGEGKAYITGVQALVKLLLMQSSADRARGLNTAGFVSGYRGSPLGGLDLALWSAKKELQAAGVRLEPGLNEELAVNMLWGTQQAPLSPGFRKDGVFGLWYGKGPGLDRSMDALKHANAAGSSKHGGVLAVAGDDHAARSSTMPHQSDHMFIGAMMPVLAPSNPQEILDLGLHGFALSRYSGCWVGFKTVAEVVESGQVVEISQSRIQPIFPSQEEFALPASGVHLRWPDDRWEQEARLQDVKVYAALAYARANHLNQIIANPKNARLGICASGKAWLDTLQALSDLGLEIKDCEALGIRLLKLGMSWPLESEIIKEFAKGLEEIVVVEEKRPIIEYLIKEQLYNWPEKERPQVFGKFTGKGEWALPRGEWMFPAKGELTPALIALALHGRIEKWAPKARARKRVDEILAKEKELAVAKEGLKRSPHYCSGCPHSASTKVPEGSRALAGIGCHFMATWIYPETQTVSQMGGEGVGWAGIAPFTDEKHIFANLGDGTFWHSGVLAIRQALSAKIPITYKLLHNDAVAMTGGQPLEGSPGPLKMLHILKAEGVEKIILCAEEPERWEGKILPEGAELRARSELERTQLELREYPGVSVLFYDQTCAAEKRRRRKKGTCPESKKKWFINKEVCEGCGDCSVKSNCLSVEPEETFWGTKRRIDQDSCNQDSQCANGFCPSFVELEDSKRSEPEKIKIPDNLPAPVFAWDGAAPWEMMIAGVGGTGVITLGQTLGMAAHLAGLGATTLDQTGLAQKGGSVSSHVKIALSQSEIKAPIVADASADLALAADLASAMAPDALRKISKTRSLCAGSSFVAPSSDFIKNPSQSLRGAEMAQTLSESSREAHFFPAARLAKRLLGDEIAANFMLAGFAWQKGWIPIPEGAIMKAIELNGVKASLNQEAFRLGRLRAVEPARFAKAEGLWESQENSPEETRRKIEERAQGWGGEKVLQAQRAFGGALERVLPGGEMADWRLVLEKERARLACYKDEYEVARLFGDSFKEALKGEFGAFKKMSFIMAPPLLMKKDALGFSRKIKIPARFAQPFFRALASMRALRGGFWDVFGRQKEREEERSDAPWFEREALDRAAGPRAPEKLKELLDASGKIRGFGPIKQGGRKKALQMLARATDAKEGWPDPAKGVSR